MTLHQVRSSYALIRSFYNALYCSAYRYPCAKSPLCIHTSQLDLHCYGEDDGDIIGRRWPHRSRESKKKILSRVKQMIQEMRSIPPARVGIANVDGGSLYDGRVGETSLRFGPFRNTQDFHRHLRRGMEFHPNLYSEVRELITQHQKPYLSTNFTHGDLSSLNILARGDKVVAIVDWKTAGWYPSYWEYTTACQVNLHNSFWRDEIEKFLDPFPEELAMDELRQKYFGVTEFETAQPHGINSFCSIKL